MKKLVCVMVFLVSLQLNAEAMLLPIGETYTGKTASQANDTPFGAGSGFSFGPLGGPVGNQYVVKKANQFTIDKPSIVQYLSVNARLVPWMNTYDIALSKYIGQRLAEGVTPEEIGLEIPSFNGPAQSISVNFALVKGSKPYHDSTTLYLPTANVLSNASYTFFTADSKHVKEYQDLVIPFAPFETELDRHAEYWIVATDPFSGISMGYSTKLFGQVNTPEPATGVLLLGGLAGLVFQRRKKS